MSDYGVGDWLIVGYFFAAILVAVGLLVRTIVVSRSPEARAAEAERVAAFKARAAYRERFDAWVDSESARYRREYVEYERRLREYRDKYPEWRRVRRDYNPWPQSSNYEYDSETWAEASDRYGNAHQSLRAVYMRIIAEHGADCMETVCIMPSRHMPAGTKGSAWDLAHDHSTGGRYDYLGPAHKQCNQAEALARGVTWTGAPTLSELIDASGYHGTEYAEALAYEAGSADEPEPPQLSKAHPKHPFNQHMGPDEVFERYLASRAERGNFYL